jgi:uncharacterized protein
MTTHPTAIAFEGDRRLAIGSLADVAAAVRKRVGERTHENLLVFDEISGRILSLDLTGSETDVRARYAKPPAAKADIVADQQPIAPRGPGRPRLGVVPREVTLLPRHWEWLNAQPGGASVALRKLVEEARKSRGPTDTLRARQEAAYRFLSAIAGDRRNYEESTRALYAGEADRFRTLTEDWPADVRDHARLLASAAFSQKT